MQKIIRVGEDVKKLEPSYSISGDANWCNCYEKHYGSFSKKKKKIGLSYDPTIILLGI